MWSDAGAVNGQQFGIGVDAVGRRHFLEERGLLHATKSPPVLPGTFEYRCGVNRAEPADELVDLRHGCSRGALFSTTRDNIFLLTRTIRFSVQRRRNRSLRFRRSTTRGPSWEAE